MPIFFSALYFPTWVMGFLPTEIEARINEEIARRELILLELKQRGTGGSSILEVIVDAEQGVNLDAIAGLSRWIGELLDENENSLPGRYRLEVSSPGLDRPLEFPWQFRRNVGRMLKLTLEEDGVGQTTNLYRLIDMSDECLSLERAVTGSKRPVKSGEPLSVRLERVVRAVVEPQF